MNMIEKVAEKVYFEIYGAVGPNIIMEQIAKRIAKAAIEAMRDISDDIIEMKVHLPTGDDCREDTRFEWEMMIDAALKDT